MHPLYHISYAITTLLIEGKYKIDGVNHGAPVALSGGVAISAAISTLSAGNHVVTAEYAGDATHAASTGTLTGGQTVKISDLRGDANCDAKVDAADAAAILRHLVRLITLSEQGQINAKVVNGVTLSAADAARILRHLVRLVAVL